MATDIDRGHTIPPVTEDDHQQGPDDAPVTVVMYGDYTCPDTRAAHPVIKRLRERFGDELRVVFRHFPRRPTHPNAERAAVLAEAAADHGRFWEMHDRLMGNPGALDAAVLAGFASELKLGDFRYEAGHPYATRVSDDVQSAVHAAINGTPAIYINGRRHDGSVDEQTLQAAIDAAR